MVNSILTLLNGGSSAISQMTATEWDCLLSDRGLDELSLWLSSNEKGSEHTNEVLVSVLCTALIRQHECIEPLLRCLKLTSNHHYQDNMASVFAVLISKGSEVGFLRMVQELVGVDDACSVKRGMLWQWMSNLAECLIDAINTYDSIKIRRHWLDLMAANLSVCSPLYFDFINTVIVGVGVEPSVRLYRADCRVYSAA